MRVFKRRLAAVLAAALCVGLAACGNGGLPDTPAPKEEIPTQVMGTVLAEFVYADAEGYFVPVARRVARTDDLTAVMRHLLNNEDSTAFFADTKLESVLPAGFDLTAQMEQGAVTVNVVGNVSVLDAMGEKRLVRGVVATALQLPGAESVSLTFNGQSLPALQNGSIVSGSFKNIHLNVDTSQYDDVSRGTPVLLYFAESGGDLLVPVARYLQNPPTLQVAVSQLCAGPSGSSKLRSLLPADTQVRYAELVDGVATVDLSLAFAHVFAQDDGGQKALRALMMTCSQFPEITQVQLMVEGQPLDATDWNMATATFANEA